MSLAHHTSSFPLFMMESIWFGENESTLKSTKFCQKSARPPPLLFLSTKNKLSNSMFRLICWNFASSAQVSTINMTEGTFAQITTSSSFPVRRFPSPWQFQTKMLMALGGAALQPPPMNFLYHLSKPRTSSLVTQTGRTLQTLYFVSE